MMRFGRHLFGIFLLLLAAVSMPGQKRQHHVVIDVTVSGTEAWNGVLNNIENLQKAFGPAEVQIEAVSHGGGLGLLLRTNTAMRERLERVAAQGVVFAACQNTMRRQHVSKDDLFPFVVTVDSGVAELVRKQEAGWSYLKVGE